MNGTPLISHSRTLHTTLFQQNDRTTEEEVKQEETANEVPVQNDEVNTASTPEGEPVQVQPETVQKEEKSKRPSPEEVAEARRKKKEAKKKKREAKEKKAELGDEDDVERKKRLRREANALKTYQGDGSEIDPKGDDLNDDIISDRLEKLFIKDSKQPLNIMFHQHTKEKRPQGSFLPTVRYWDEYGITPNPYNRIRLNQVFSKWAKRDLRTMSNDDYLGNKYNTFARMNATNQYHGIFPGIINKFTPTINLVAEYNDPIARDILCYYGNNIPARFVGNKPNISFKGHSKSYYTLMLVDAKTEEYLEEYPSTIQWMITDIPGSTGDITQGNELVEYFGPTPLKEQGYHRMVFLLFRQKTGVLRQEKTLEKITSKQFHEREPFDVKEFVLQNDLLPRGLTFYTCEYDNSVPKRFEELGFGEPQFISEEHIRRKAARKEKGDEILEVRSKKWTWPLEDNLSDEGEHEEEDIFKKE